MGTRNYLWDARPANNQAVLIVINNYPNTYVPCTYVSASKSFKVNISLNLIPAESVLFWVTP